MRIIIIDYNYPSSTNLYGSVFVHVRVKEYAKTNQCLVITNGVSSDYIYEGIDVRVIGNEQQANQIINEFNADVIFIHFALKSIIEEILPHCNKPVFIWVHGFEALGWYRRLFNYSLRVILSRSYAYEVRDNIRQLLAYRKLIISSNKIGNPKFIFVSNWMRRICEIDCAIRVHNYAVIPNPIDTGVFFFAKKPVELRNKILLIRSFASRKYATDIAIDAIMKLSKRPEFARFQITIVGQGRLFDQQVKPMRSFNNVKLVNSFLSHAEIKRMHDAHGIYLSPTRQDAQGVSMCEAMSSGMVVITSNNTAIPEFVKDGTTGFLSTSVHNIVDRILEIDKYPERFSAISENAACSMKNLCSMESVIKKEMDFVRNSVIADVENERQNNFQATQ